MISSRCTSQRLVAPSSTKSSQRFFTSLFLFFSFIHSHSLFFFFSLDPQSETYRDNVQMVFALFNEEIKISSSDSALKRLHSGLSEDRNSRTSILFRNKTSA